MTTGRVVAAALALLAGLTLAVLVHPGPLPGELAYVDWLQSLGGPVPEAAELVRLVTGTEGSLVVGALPAVWLVRRRGRAGAAAVLVVVVAMLVVQPLFKELVDRPRPDATQVDVRAEHSSTSFPSGHSLSTTALYGVAVGLALRERRRAPALLAAVPVVVTGVASGVQGVHWPSDALAGTITGALAAALAVRLLRADQTVAGTVEAATVPRRRADR
jgi:undecaprenyl-diphosphatase